MLVGQQVTEKTTQDTDVDVVQVVRLLAVDDGSQCRDRILLRSVH